MADTPIPPAYDRLTGLVEAALGQSRVVRPALHSRVIPHLPPIRRGPAEHVIRRIDRSGLFEPTALADLEALLVQVECAVEQGTRDVFRANECDPGHGHVERERTPAVTELAAAAVDLRDLHRRIGAALDAVEAVRIANRLAGEG